jgi:hypothetical protein
MKTFGELRLVAERAHHACLVDLHESVIAEMVAKRSG